MMTDAAETPVQLVQVDVQVETTAAAEVAPPRRTRARLWLAAVGFLLAAAVVLAGLHAPDVHAHHLQAAAAARRLRNLQPAAAAVEMPKKYSKKEPGTKVSSATKKAQRNKTGGGR